ncbi:efflux RND transporter periplasmic adaptor subunit [Microbulbifer aggregans]|uniref:efflux RND transporter periplasmic adaptor subunit n=1 Tax=Microbulbifer aggregans TaxID=1769779 RepID=UPI001CFC6762|nr:efflux RND transporter periplasmic adaptor subunit [Microbulbifer aggregans]
MSPVSNQSLSRRFCHVAFVLAALALTACSAPEAGQQKPPRPAIVAQPTLSGAQLAVYPGEVRPRHEPTLAFRIGGEITERLVETGDRVIAGQPLAKLDPQDLLLQRDSARAQLAAAEAEHRNARSELTRYRDLLKRKLVSESQFETVQTRFDASAAQLAHAKSQLEVAENQTSYTVLKAPRDGIIARRMIDSGQIVAAGQSVFSLAADGEREVRIDLPEQDFTRFAVGQAVTLELWSRPDTPFKGQIRELSPAADPNLRTFEARIAFNNQQIQAELGQSARVYVQNPLAKGRLSVPMAAVTADSGQAYVWALNPETMVLKKVLVTVVSYGDETAEIHGSLTPDSWILAAGTQLVQDGQRVRPVDRQNRPIEFGANLAQNF